MRSLACLGVIGLGFTVAIASASCSSKDEGAPPTVDASTPTSDGAVDVWTVGVSDSLTGGLAGIGTQLQNAVKVAESYINSKGGVAGKPIRFIIEDDQSSEDDGDTIARTTIQKLLDEGAVAVIGPNGSGQVNAVQDLLYNAKVVELSATATSPVLTGVQPAKDRYFFRTVPADDFQGKALVRFAVSGPPGIGGGSGDGGTDSGSSGGAACKRMALFYYTNPYGTAMAKVVKDNFPTQSSGGSIVADISVDTTVKGDYNAEVKQIQDANPDCLAMIIYDDVGDVFLTSLKSAMTTTPGAWSSKFFVIGTDGTYTQALIDNGRANKADPTSPTVAEGIYGTNPDTNPQTNDYTDFKNLYVSLFPLPAGKTDIEAYTANEFDAAMLVALAIAQAGGTSDKVALRDVLVKVASKGKAHGPGDLTGALADIQNGIDIDYRGASGPVDLDDNGNVTAGYIVWHVKDGQFEVIARYSSSDVQ